MTVIFRFITLAALVLFIEQTYARRHHHDLISRNTHQGAWPLPPIDSIDPKFLARDSNDGVLKMGDTNFVNLATSYIVENSSSGADTGYVPPENELGGACAWAAMPRKTLDGSLIYGVAIQTKFFEKGKSCGMCIQLEQTGPTQPGRQNSKSHSKFFEVVVVDECPNNPNNCVSLDMQVDGMLKWQDGPRVGQVPVNPKVVPCRFKEKGIFIEARQITPSPWDFRVNVRGQGGAIKYLFVAGPDGRWHLLNKSESNQYTLPTADQHLGYQILTGQTFFSLLAISYQNERLALPRIPHYLNTANFNKYFNTGKNFVHS